ncbi:DUF1648 domain-containing protein [Streptomyces sp. 1114.5]|uniref:DUF1648 domain-containing protein n=1 Tax=Streptomyces sp. 1114.5 TaxID=1938830 RepID=UPI00217D2E71|nr:DUF1648 domain-containing protein [Streptomyces sp. 1114.5]
MTDEGATDEGATGEGVTDEGAGTVQPGAGKPARRGARRGALWGAAVWSVGVLALLVALPLAARHRLPDPLATHWGGRDPDGSMSLTAAVLFPAGLWLVLVALSALARRYWDLRTPGAAAAVLAGGGVLLTGAQTSIVHANLDRVRWQDAAPMGIEVVLIMLATAGATTLAWLAGRRNAGPAEQRPAAGSPVLQVPAGERFVWLSRAANPWLQLLAAVLGLAAVAGALTAASGLAGPDWSIALSFGLPALAVLACSSVQARVTSRGLTVGFGPFGRPARHWAPEDLVSARAEERTAAQAGGWGYRINSRGTTVMLRRGACLVVRTRQGAEFAVSVDDAERGAALLNALIARSGQPTG